MSAALPSRSSLPSTSTAMRVAKRKTRSISCSISSTATSSRQRGDAGQDFFALGFRNASGGFVEQEHAWAAGDGDGDLEQALLAVRQVGGSGGHEIGEVEAAEDLGGLVDGGVAAAERAPPTPGQAEAAGDGQGDGLERGHGGEKLVDLEGAYEAELDAAVTRGGGDVVAAEHDLAGGRGQDASQEIDQRGLAGTVRSDQRLAGAGLEREGDVVGHMQGAEAAVQAADLQRGGHAFWRQPRSGLRPTIARITSSNPTQNSQYCGVSADSQSCTTRNTAAPTNPP